MVAVERFFSIAPENYNNWKAGLMDDAGDVLALDVLKNAYPVYQDEEKVIVLALLGKKLQKAICEFTNAEDPLSLAALQELGVALSYCGEEYSSDPINGLFSYFPELAGIKQVETTDDNGETIIVEVPVIKVRSWF